MTVLDQIRYRIEDAHAGEDLVPALLGLLLAFMLVSVLIMVIRYGESRQRRNERDAMLGIQDDLPHPVSLINERPEST